MEGFILKDNKKSIIIIAIILAVAIVGTVGYYAYQQNHQYMVAVENSYNMSFFELVDYVQKNIFGKSTNINNS